MKSEYLRWVIVNFIIYPDKINPEFKLWWINLFKSMKVNQSKHKINYTRGYAIPDGGNGIWRYHQINIENFTNSSLEFSRICLALIIDPQNYCFLFINIVISGTYFYPSESKRNTVLHFGFNVTLNIFFEKF